MFIFDPGTKETKGIAMPYEEQISLLHQKLEDADAVVIGAGSGLSTAAGYVYTGDRFNAYFKDFREKYHFNDMYSGGFYPYQTMEEFWGYWCRYIWINRYAPIPGDLYEKLLSLVKDKDYFVLTTNVDHCFQRAGFDKKRLFYTQGDYGLLQSSEPSKRLRRTYDNEEIIRRMVLDEGFEIAEDKTLIVPENKEIRMTVSSDLVPYCPDDGKAMVTNLRGDDTFVEDAGWHIAAERYQQFIERHEGTKVLYLELGVGMNTPVIIKYPFRNYTERSKNAFYACVNYGQASTSESIEKRSLCINSDISQVVNDLLEQEHQK